MKQVLVLLESSVFWAAAITGQLCFITIFSGFWFLAEI